MAEQFLNKEKNFVSAVVYMHNEGEGVTAFFEQIKSALEARFEQYEIIAVDDRCTDSTVEAVRTWAKSLEKPLTILHMSLYQGVETAMNAGLSCAIGDYVFEFDCAKAAFPTELIGTSYDTALSGSDIVAVCPVHQSASSKLFYGLFNRFSRSAYALRTDLFRVVSRRAINRVHAISANLPYRKAAYAASGLKMTALESTVPKVPKTAPGGFNLAVDSLALYTDAGYACSLFAAGVMFLLAIAELLYTIIVYFNGTPIEGWTTMMFVLTVGFAGLFALFAIALKYLSLILSFTFRKQICLVESIEKIQK